MVFSQEKTFTECETRYVEPLNIYNERTHGDVQALRFHHANQPTGTYAMHENVNGEPDTCMSIHAVPAKQNNSSPISIGQDLWSQLKRVQMPVFYGDKRKATFLACIDAAPVTAEYKLLQLRQYVAGAALYAIDSLGHSAHAYEAAKDRLERMFGGKRRQVLIYFEDLGNFPQICDGNAKDLEQFADLLDSAVISLHEAGKHAELGDGFLYITLQRKLPQSMLASYHRWVYENNISESVITLKTWVVQESEFQTIANETIHGFACPSAAIQTKRHISNYDESRTFFGETGAIQSLQKQILCRLCGANHCIWQCQKYIQKSVPERWNFAKQFRLCYRCLVEGHLGKLCPKSRQCGLNGCQKLHHRLLHKTDNLCMGDLSQTKTIIAANTELKECSLDPATLIGDAFTFGMKGKGKTKQTQKAMTYATYSFETTWDKSNSKKKSKHLDSSKSKNRSTSWDSSKSNRIPKSCDSSKSKKISKYTDSSKYKNIVKYTDSSKLSKSWDSLKSKKISKSWYSSKSKKIFEYWDISKSKKRYKFWDSSKSKKNKFWDSSKSKKRYKFWDRSKSKKSPKSWENVKSKKISKFRKRSKFKKKFYLGKRSSAIIRSKFRTRSRFQKQLSLREDVHVRFGELQVGQGKLTRAVRKLCSLHLEL